MDDVNSAQGRQEMCWLRRRDFVPLEGMFNYALRVRKVSQKLDDLYSRSKDERYTKENLWLTCRNVLPSNLALMGANMMIYLPMALTAYFSVKSLLEKF